MPLNNAQPGGLFIMEPINKHIEKTDEGYILVCPWPWNIDLEVRKILDSGYSYIDILRRNYEGLVLAEMGKSWK